MSATPQIEETPLTNEITSPNSASIENTPEIAKVYEPKKHSKFAWKESLTDKFDENNTEPDNVNRIQSFTGYHLQFKTWKKN